MFDAFTIHQLQLLYSLRKGRLPFPTFLACLIEGLPQLDEAAMNVPDDESIHGLFFITPPMQ
jgi:hypothetical protein